MFWNSKQWHKGLCSTQIILKSLWTCHLVSIHEYYRSAFGIVVTQWADGIVQIMHAEEYHRPDYNEMLSVVYGLMSKYDIDKVYIDGANPSFIKSLKLQIGEDADYDKVIARYKSEGLGGV